MPLIKKFAPKKQSRYASVKISKIEVKQNKTKKKIKEIIFKPKDLLIAVCAELFSMATFVKTFSDAKLVKTITTPEIATRYKYLPNSISEA